MCERALVCMLSSNPPFIAESYAESYLVQQQELDTVYQIESNT